jgi:hypothetical protein
MVYDNLTGYETPDEKLSYSELKERIKAECVRSLPAKERAGRDLETIVRRYNTIIKSAVESGGPVPLGTYIITKPDMKLVPVRIFVNFEKRTIEILLWEKKLLAN